MTNEPAQQDITYSRLFAIKPKRLLQRLYLDGLITLQQAEEVLSARKPEESAQMTIIRLGLLNHEQMLHYMRLLNNISEQGQVDFSPAVTADSDSSKSGRTKASSDQEEQDFKPQEEQDSKPQEEQDSKAQEEQDSKAQGKPKKQKDPQKQKEAPIPLGEQLLRDKVITAGQLDQSLAQQGRTGESMIRILVRNGSVGLSQLEPYVKIGDLRKFAVLDLENDYYQGNLHIMLIHRRNFRLFLGVCALTILAAVWLHDQIQVMAYLFALAALATVYHRIQRRYYDLQAFFRQTRTTVLNALDSCTTVGELSMVRDNARAGFAAVVPLDYEAGSSKRGHRRLLGLLGVTLVVVFVALLLLGTIKTHAELRSPGLSQDTTQSISVK